MARRPALAIGAATMVLAAAAPAGAAPQVTHDSAGRPIHFDVQAQGADVAGYTAILDGLLHGERDQRRHRDDRPQSSIATECGTGAAACYRWSSRGDAVMFVPSQAAAQVRGSLTHEYGHHVDADPAPPRRRRGLDGTAGLVARPGHGDAPRAGPGGLGPTRGAGTARSPRSSPRTTSSPTRPARPRGSAGWAPPPPAVSDAIRADLAGPDGRAGAAAQPPLPPPAAGTPARTSPGAGPRRRPGERAAEGRPARVGAIRRSAPRGGWRSP